MQRKQVYARSAHHTTKFTAVRCDDTQDALHVTQTTKLLVLWKLLPRGIHHSSLHARERFMQTLDHNVRYATILNLLDQMG